MNSTYTNFFLKCFKDGKLQILFSHGGCYYFAIKASRLGLGNLRQIEHTHCKSAAHVFVITDDGLAFDHMGFRPIAHLRRDHPPTKEPSRITELQLLEIIQNQNTSQHIQNHIFDLAERLISQLLLNQKRPQYSAISFRPNHE